MTNRVLLDSNNFKVSRPGIDVLTATAPKDFLLFNNYSTMGAFQTGTISVPASYPFIKQTFPLNNNTGYVPLVLVQQHGSGGTYAIGGGWYEDIDGFALENDGGFREPEDPIEYQPAYFNTENSTGFRLHVSENYFEIEHISIAPVTYRFVAFYPQTALANFTPIPRDIIPNAISFDDVISAWNNTFTTLETVSGIDQPVYIEIESNTALASGTRVDLLVSGSGSSPTFIDEGATKSTSLGVIVNGGTIQLKLSGPTAQTYTLTIRNVSDGGTILDTVTLTNNTTTSLINNVAWQDESGSGWVRTDPQTIQGPNVPVNLQFSSNQSADTTHRRYQVFVDRENTVLPNAWTTSTTSSLSVGANVDQQVSWGISSRTTMNNTVTITNTTPSPDQTVDNFNINVAADNRICNHVSFGAVSANNSPNNTVTGVNSNVTFTGHTGTINLAVTVPAFTPSGGSSQFNTDTALFRIYRNNVLISTLDCSFTAQAGGFTVTPGDQIKFEAYLVLEDDEEFPIEQTWVGAVGLYHADFANMFMDVFTLNITAKRSAGFGGGGPGGF